MFNKIKSLLWKRKYIFLFIGLFLIVVTQRFLNERQNGLVNSVSSDGLGYYCYLPAAIIYQDFTYSFYYKDENKIKPFYRPYISPYKDRGVNKYYCGSSICFLPFFLTGIVISAIAGTEINGYTDTFLMLISIGALIYYLLSVFMLTKIGRFFGVPEKISLLTCLMFFFSTNQFQYTIQEPSMSHAYSFFAVSLFFYLYIKLLEHTTNKNIFLLGLALGLVALVRPVNVVVVLFTPFFSESIRDYILFLKTIFVHHIKGLLLFILAMVAAVALQFTFYYLQTGDFFIVSYEGETFNFAHPEFFNVLFSYRKGLFIYVPILLAALLFILFSKNNWYKKIIFFITFTMFLYITASWWCWWYGGGLSIRPIVDILPVVVIITMLFVSKLTLPKRKTVFAICIPFLFMSQLTAYQYSNALLDSSNMTQEKFWDLFLETDLATINEKKIARITSGKAIVKMELMNYEDGEGDNRITNEGYHSSKSSIVGEKNYYSKGFCFPLKDLGINDNFYIVIECMAKATKEGKDLGLVASVDEDGACKQWFVVFKNQFNDNSEGWAKMTQVIEIDKYTINEKSVLKIFANTQKGNNLVDDLKYTIVRK
jgi:hypothetical protein